MAAPRIRPKGKRSLAWLPLNVRESSDSSEIPGGDGDIHTQYQLRSEKGEPLGYAPLDSIGDVPLEHIPAGVARDSEVAAAQAAAQAYTDATMDLHEIGDTHPIYTTDAEAEDIADAAIEQHLLDAEHGAGGGGSIARTFMLMGG